MLLEVERRLEEVNGNANDDNDDDEEEEEIFELGAALRDAVFAPVASRRSIRAAPANFILFYSQCAYRVCVVSTGGEGEEGVRVGGGGGGGGGE